MIVLKDTQHVDNRDSQSDTGDMPYTRWPSDRCSAFLKLLREYFSAFGAEADLMREYAAIILGKSPLFASEGFLKSFSGCEKHVIEWVMSKLVASPPVSEDGVKSVFDALMKYVGSSLKTGEIKGRIGQGAVEALGTIANRSRATKAIVELILRDLDNVYLATFLAAFPAGEVSSSEEYRNALWKAYKESREQRVKVVCVIELCSYIQDDPSVKKELFSKYWEFDEELRSAVVNGLHHCDARDGEAFDFATRVLRAESSTAILSSAVTVLAKRAGPADEATLTLVRAFLTSGSITLRLSCVTFLGLRGDGQDLPALENLTRSDPDDVIRRKAETACADIRSRLQRK